MSQAYKCDRCGKLYEAKERTLESKNYSVLKPHTMNYIISNSSTYLRYVADLCPGCQEQLDEWIVKNGTFIRDRYNQNDEQKHCSNCKFGDIDNAPICDMCDCANSNWKPKEDQNENSN